MGVKSGSTDIISKGLSTFMVEMVETAHILNHATKESLVIMDEIGRGTSTYDGMSIAWAIIEYLVKKVSAKTLFTTHYHELQALADEYPKKIQNYHVATEERKGAPIFLHTVRPGGASHSYGVAVAQLAGVPKDVTKRARTLLSAYENKQPTTNGQQQTTPNQNDELRNTLSSLDLNSMTPLEALETLVRLQKDIGQ